MRPLKRTLLLLLLPLLLFGIIWRVNWRREHPPATALDEQTRAYLAATDRVKVVVETSVLREHILGEQTFVTNLPCAELRPIIRYLNVLPSTYNATASWAILYFELYKGDKYQGNFGINYGESPPLTFVTAPPLALVTAPPPGMTMHPTSARRLRQFIAQHPEIVRALVKVGVPAQELKSD